jgi:predicted phage baseplate assembly protein
MTVVDPRSAADFDATLRSRVPGYLPGWDPAPDGAASAILAIAARMSAVVADRLNRAPAKNELAFLDMLGVSLLPAQAARAPVMFTLRPGLADSRAPAGTQVGATVEGVDGPLIYETERDIALVGAKLVEVATVLPGSDQWASHTSDYAAGRPFTLFDGLQPVSHELYLAHDVHFALQGSSEVGVQLEVTATGQRRIPTVWEYWDGDAWSAFASFEPDPLTGDPPSIDGTDGLTRSGTVVLRVKSANAKRRIVNWVDSYWIRARCADPLTPDYAAHLPTINRVAVGSLVAIPIGSLSLTADRKPPDKWPEAKDLKVSAKNFLFVSPEPSAASIRIEQLDVQDKYEDTRSLAGGDAVLGPVPSTKEGDYQFSVDIPGFQFASTKVKMSNSGESLTVDLGPDLLDRRPDKGDAAGLPLDLSKPCRPFGPSPLAGTACHLMISDALSKPHARVTLVAIVSDFTQFNATILKPAVDLEYFNGSRWYHLDFEVLQFFSTNQTLAEIFTQSGGIQFEVPDDLAITSVNEIEGYWIRFTITSGMFGQTQTINIPSNTPITTREVISPVVESIRYSYYYRSKLTAPTACHTCNDFAWIDHSSDAVTSGEPFVPFSVVADPTPAVYLGFDAELPPDVLSLYIDGDEVAGEESAPSLVWECLDDTTWLTLITDDETGAMTLPGTARIAYPGVTRLATRRGVQTDLTGIRPTDLTPVGQLRPGDVVTVGDDSGTELAVVATVDDRLITFRKPTAKLHSRAVVTKTGPARFGSPRASWIRVRLRNDGDPPSRTLNGVYLNTAWATNVQTRHDEILGTSDGNPSQSVSFAYAPVLPGERIEILELSGQRAQVDVDDVRDDVFAHGGSDDDVRPVRDRVTGLISQVWVRWTEQPNLYFSRPTDRHYTIERTRGLVVFGDDRHGRVPPTVADGIVARVYRSGGRSVGNVGLGAINQLLSGVPAASVTNIRAAQGGADGESTSAVMRRGPASVAARIQAITVADYEVLAREASPAVAFARALPATDPSGRPRPGWVRLIVVPDSSDSRPLPSFELRRLVENYVRRRCPASMAGQVYVVAPDYQPVGVSAEIQPVDIDNSGATFDRVSDAVEEFLHPLTGGPESVGWAFGRNVYVSDLANVIGGVAGVDHIRNLELLLDGTPHGQVVAVPPDRIVVAGDIVVRLAGGE